MEEERESKEIELDKGEFEIPEDALDLPKDRSGEDAKHDSPIERIKRAADRFLNWVIVLYGRTKRFLVFFWRRMRGKETALLREEIDKLNTYIKETLKSDREKIEEELNKKFDSKVQEEARKLLETKLKEHRAAIPVSRFVQSSLKRKEKRLEDREEEIKHLERKFEIKEAEANLNEKVYEMREKQLELISFEAELDHQRKALLIDIAKIEFQRKELRFEREKIMLEIREKTNNLLSMIEDFKHNQQKWTIDVKMQKMAIYNQSLELYEKKIDQDYQYQRRDIELRLSKVENAETRAKLEKREVQLVGLYNTAQSKLREAQLMGKHNLLSKIEMDRKISVIESIESGWMYNNDLSAMDAYNTAGYYLTNPYEQEVLLLRRMLEETT